MIHGQGWAAMGPLDAVAEVSTEVFSEASADVPAAGTLLLQRAWRRGLVEAGVAPHGRHWILLFGEDEWAREVEAEVASVLPQARCVVVAGGGEGIARRYQAGVLQVLDLLQRIVRDKPKDDVLIQAVVAMSGEEAVFAALSGLLKAARLEQPKLKGQVVAFEPQVTAPEIVNRLIENARVPDEHEVRYVSGEREVASWCALPPDSLAEVPWRDGGVYLITGGAGGLGLIFAEEIGRRVRGAVVVLTGRSELDESRRIQLSALEGRGNRIEYRRVDVADGAAVSHADRFLA